MEPVAGIAVTTLAKSYLEEGKEVHIITGNHTDTFDKIPEVVYRVVPFRSEDTSLPVLPGACDFNYLMFTTHTESTANFWDATLEQIHEYEEAFKTAISKEIEEFKPDILHGQHNWISTSIATDYHVPVVLTIHGTDLMGFEKSVEQLHMLESTLNTASPEDKPAIEKEIEKYQLYIQHANHSAQNAKKIIVISMEQKEKFETLFPFAKEKVVLIPNGYDPNTFYEKENVDKETIFSSLQAHNYSSSAIPACYDHLVLFVGKFAAFKGIDILLDSAKQYEERMQKLGKTVYTLIVGSGQLDATLQKQAQTLGLQHTYFVGRKNSAEICDLQNLADVSLIPSRNEPFGLVVIEGTACGHPVIGTNAGGIPDILNTTGKIIKEPYLAEYRNNPSILTPDAGTTGSYTTDLGILVPMDDSTALANAVCDVLTKKKQFDNHYIASYTKTHFSQKEITQKILRIFEECL